MAVTAWEQIGSTIRRAWEQRHRGSGRRWDEVEPSYRFSYEMSRDPRYGGRRWGEVEPGLRSDYGAWARSQGYGSDAGTWDRVGDDVREAWESIATRSEATTLNEAATLSGATTLGGADALGEGRRTLELREEQLVPHKELREVGEVRIRTRVEEVPGRLEVEALREEVEVEHEPVGEVVSERVAPWEEDGVLYVPVYEEQLVMVKRLLLREHLKIRRIATTETRLFEDTLRREEVVVEDPNNTGLVHERFPTDPTD